MLVGIPGSGKSYYADIALSKGYADEVFSSDAYREKLLGDVNNQNHNDYVFKTLYSDIAKSLKDDKTCIFDATNINRKSRKGILNYLKNAGIECEKEAILFATQEELAIERNNNRERKVPEEVIHKFIKRFELPLTGEGFDKVDYYVDCDEKKHWGFYLKEALDFDQKNPHHTKDLYNHMSNCFNKLVDTHDSELMVAGMLHDIGKLYTQTVDDEGVGHYYNHENIGAYKALFIDYTPLKIDFYKVAFYINYHMEPYRLANAKPETLEKYKKIFGSEWDSIMLLHKADEEAH